MGGGGGPPEESTTFTSQALSPELARIFGLAAGGLEEGLDAVSPQWGRVSAYDPQTIPGMTSQESSLLAGLLEDIGAGGDISETYRSMLGPIGKSPLMETWRRQNLPQILQGANIGGLGQGAQAEVIASAADEHAMQIAQMQQQAAEALANLQGFGLSQASLPREIKGQVGEAEYNEIQRLQSLLESLTIGPFGALAPSGQTSMSRTSNVGGGK